jgi:hypothetical protein
METHVVGIWNSFGVEIANPFLVMTEAEAEVAICISGVPSKVTFLGRLGTLRPSVLLVVGG